MPTCHIRRNTRRAIRGFTMVEILVTLSMAGVLSSVALPTFQGHLQKARRADVVVSMMQVQLAQSRWRANSSNYGTLAQLGVSSVSMGGHYTLTLGSADDDRYEVLASATGAQAADTACRHMQLRVVGANVVQASGPDATVANPAAVNRKCWNQ
jgi:type IV pilus assembly protein PilE